MRPPPLVSLAASLTIALVIGGCASLESVALAVTPAMVSAAPGASAASLHEGRRIFTGPCASCHAPDPMSKYALSEWRAAVEEMAPRAKLDASRRAALLEYLTAAKATAPRQ